jgi:transglycosylase-like protein with SLT domain
LARPLVVLLCLFVLPVSVRGQTALDPARLPASPCEQAGRDAERQYTLPAGLLGAIGRVESGRWDATLGRTVPSPWAIDAAGTPVLPISKEDALRQVHDLQAAGVRNIDVGCFQISLLHHPSAFPELDQAFEPTANADYAARFLTSLYARYGSWEQAVAAYHSATPERGIPYQQQVFANWVGPAGSAAITSASPASLRTGAAASPVTVFNFGGAELRVWTPSQAGTAASIVSMEQTAARAGALLPRVTTPDR